MWFREGIVADDGDVEVGVGAETDVYVGRRRERRVHGLLGGRVGEGGGGCGREGQEGAWYGACSRVGVTMGGDWDSEGVERKGGHSWRSEMAA